MEDVGADYLLRSQAVDGDQQDRDHSARAGRGDADHQARRCPDQHRGDLVPPFDVEAMYSELWMLAESGIGDVPLRRLVMTLLTKTAKQLKRVPASQKHWAKVALDRMLSIQ